MVGQGGPQRDNIRRAFSAVHLRRQRFALRIGMAFVCALAGCWSASWAGAAEQDLEMRLRMAWGAGASAQWEGFLRVAGGTISDLRDIGLSAETGGTKYIEQDTIRIAQAAPTDYDGMDFTVQAPADAIVTVELRSLEPPGAVTRVETPLADFIALYENRRLDESDNRLLIRRSPGDVLRIELDRDSLVFVPGEKFTFGIEPHLLELEPNVAIQLKIQLFPARGDRELWEHQMALRSGADGALQIPEIEPVPLPLEEGAYDVVVSLFRRPRLGVPLWRVVPIAQRKIQLVTISPKAPAPSSAEWRELATIDSANPKWRTWAAQLTGLNKIPGFDQTKPLGSGTLEEVALSGEKMLRLGPDQWQAYPLEIAAPHQPYILEVEYPSHVAQSLGISIIEPNAAGDVAPIGVDSGVRVPPHLADAQPTIQRHRLVFWPRTAAPLVLLVNQNVDGPAYFGRIRLYGGPTSLPPAELEAAGSVSAGEQRLLAAYFDKPLFPANFAATDDFDPTREQTLDDWKKFYEGGKRLVEYLKYAGYNGAVICVAREGSTLYPSAVLPDSPKYDNGVYFTSGQDVIRKDVLEMLFRLFDREGLQLVPAVSLAGRVHRIEALRRAGGAIAEGLTLVDSRGRAAATQYNPLDPRIQDVVRGAAHEIATRYGAHASYGGMAIQLGPDTYMSFPDEEWGLDAATFTRFLRTLPRRDPVSAGGTPAERAALLQTPELRQAWLLWRATEMARLYSDVHQLLRQPRPDARLYLATGDLFQGRATQRLLQPSLSSNAAADLSEAALIAGVDQRLYRDQTGILLLAPRRLATGLSLNEQATNLQLAAAGETYFGVSTADSAAEMGSLFFHEPYLQRLPSFDAKSPFGPERTFTHLYSHAAIAGAHNRKRFVQSLAAFDAQVMLDGGWLLPMGQEASLAELIETYRLVPRVPFVLVEPRSEMNTEPVVVRQALHAGQRYFYVVNDSPWIAQVTLEIPCRLGAKLVPLGGRNWSPSHYRAGRIWWTIQLEPYDLVAAHVDDPEAQVDDWQVQLAPHILSELARQVRDVGVRADLALQRPPLKALINPDFEAPSAGAEIPGWQFKTGAGVAVRLDTARPHQGKAALHLQSAGEPLWIRSNAFRPPATGRLYVLVRLRVKDADQQPNLRVVLDDDKGFYLPLPIGGSSSGTKLPDGWREDYLFPFENLPIKDLELLHLGFDLMGAGEVWIDDIQMFDLWLQREERNALLTASGLAGKSLERGKVLYCQRFLDSFWPQFLLEHVPSPTPGLTRTATLTETSPSGPVGDLRPAADEAPKRSAMDRVRGLVPKVRRPFRR